MNPDAVVVELIADVRGLTPATNKAADDFDRSMKKIGDSANLAGVSVERMAARIANGQRNLGRQIADVGTQLSGGQNPFLIIAQQAPQVADALTDMGGAAGKVASFFSGPWGAALLAAASAAGVLLSDVIKLGNAVDDHVKKLKEQWKQTQAAEKADRLFAESLEGVQKATKDATLANDEWLHGLDNALLKTAAETALQYKNALAIRETTKARLADAIALYKLKQEEARGAGQRGEGAALTAPLYGDTVSRLQDLLGAQNVEVGALQERADQARIDFFSSEIEKSVNPLKRVSQLWDNIIQQKKEELALSHASNAQVQASLGLLYRQRDAAIAKAQADEAAAKRKGPRPSRDEGPNLSSSGIDLKALRAAVMGQESGGNPNAVSSAGARGLMQTMPGTSRDPGFGVTAARGNSAGELQRVGNDYLDAMLRRYDGDVTLALIAYNWGPGNLDRLLKAVGDPRTGAISDKALLAKVPAKETRDYVPSVIARARNGKTDDGLLGQVDKEIADAAAADLKFNKLLDETQDKITRLFGKSPDDRAKEQWQSVFGKDDPLKDSLDTIGPNMRGRTDAWDEENQRRQRIQEKQIYELSDLYESLFTGGVKGVWDEFKREGLRTLALLLAKWTVAALTKQTDGGGLGDLIKSVGAAASSAFGGGGASPRASGGPVEAGRLYHINESASGGRVEGFVPSTSGKVIPLGSMRAASSGGGITVLQTVSVDARGSVMNDQFAVQILARAGQNARDISAAYSRGAVEAAPARVQRMSTLGS